ncbi:MAG: hypothetical protein ACOX6C_00675 [Patescibacteria group bacterium]|jgi:hypothetical protein
MKKKGIFETLDWLNKYSEQNYSKNPSFWLRIFIFSSDYKAREYAWEKVKEFSPEEIINDLDIIIRLAPICQVAEEKVIELIKSLPPEAFEAKMKNIFSLVNDPETAEVAAIILRDLPVFYLSHYFLVIINLLNNSHLMSTRKLMRELLAKIIGSWSLDEKRRNFQLILDFEESSNHNLSTAANLAHLEVIKSGPVEDLEKNLDYLVKMTTYPDSKISILAAELAFTFFSEYSNQEIKESYLEYCKSFSGWGRKELRRGFRFLALKTILDSQGIDPAKHVGFLIGCLDSHDRHERSIAISLLRKIKASDLPLNLLLQAQYSTLSRVRRQTRILANKISSDQLAENLELLLKAQESLNHNYSDLAADLALKIPKEKILEKKELLDRYLESSNLRVKLIARMLTTLNF